MLKKTIPLFILGLALAGCGNDNNGAMGDNDERMSPEVREEMNESANPGIPEVGDIDIEGNNDGFERNDGGGVNGNNGMNGAGDNGELDGNLKAPGTDGIDGDGLNNNRT